MIIEWTYGDGYQLGIYDLGTVWNVSGTAVSSGYSDGQDSSWLGEYKLGDRLPLVLWVRNGSGVPTLPDDAPRAIVSNDTEMIESKLLPIHDKSNTTALFLSDVNLDGKYDTGNHTVQYLWESNGTVLSAMQYFTILGGGDPQGTGIAMEYFAVNPTKYLLVQSDNGTLVRRKNPRIS